MPRDIKKLKELQEIINKKDLEIAKYKQLVKNIQALITINGVKLHEDDYIDLLGGETIGDKLYKKHQQDEEKRQPKERTDKRKVVYYEDKPVIKPDFKDNVDYDDEMPSKEEIREKAAESEKKKPELKKCINCQEVGNWEGRSFCPKCENKDYTDENDDEITPKSHVDELKELQKKGTTKPSEIKKVVKKQPHALDELREKATEPTATANQNLTLEERIAKLPPEAQAQIRANQARAKAAEKSKSHGEEGDKEYARLLKKEKQERGEIPIGGTCPHCKEILEAPITRGYHTECWEAKQRKEQQQ